MDVKRIPELMELSFKSGEGLRLGASVPCYRIYENAAISAAYPALADAARIVGGWQIQSRASVGGNLCNSSPAGDTIPPLIVHDARCVIVGPEGHARGPGRGVLHRAGQERAPARRDAGDARLPAPAAHSGSAYERFIPRNEMDIAVVGAASWVQLDAATARRSTRRGSRLAAVAPTPRLAAEASKWLAGKPATERSSPGPASWPRRPPRRSATCAGPPSSGSHLVGVLTRRTLAKAVERARRSWILEFDLASRITDLAWNCRIHRNPKESSVAKKIHVTTTVNGEQAEFLCEPRQSLLEVLRDTLRLTGAKEGCNNGNCGACTVLLNGVPVNSCLVLAVEAEGAAIETVEGLAKHGHLHPIQQCFLEGAALQCGVCTPGLPRRRQGAARQEPESRASTRSASTWPATSAAARATTRS